MKQYIRLTLAVMSALAAMTLVYCSATEVEQKPADSETNTQIENDTTTDAPSDDSADTSELFTDVPNDSWFAKGVEYVYGKKLMNGTGNDLFSPDLNITRGMTVTIIYRFAGSPEVNGTADFTDIPADAYYSVPVAWAVSEGIVNGYTDGTFKPDNEITREQLAVIIRRYASSLEFDGISSDNVKSQMQTYSDYNSISSYAVEAMEWVFANDLIKGTSDSTLEPFGNATRAQAATVFMRLDRLLGTADDVSDEPETAPDDSKDNDTITKPDDSKDNDSETKPDDSKDDDSETKPDDSKDNDSETKPNDSKDNDSEIKPDDSDTPVTVNKPSFIVGSVTAKAGQTLVEVPVKVVKNPGILGMTLKIEYDDNALTLVGSEFGNALDMLTSQAPKRFKSGCNYIWYGETIGDDEIRDGDILILKFTVSPNAKSGDHTVTVTYADGDILNNDLQALTLDVIDGKITVE